MWEVGRQSGATSRAGKPWHRARRGEAERQRAHGPTRSAAVRCLLAPSHAWMAVLQIELTAHLLGSQSRLRSTSACRCHGVRSSTLVDWQLYAAIKASLRRLPPDAA